MSLHNQKVSVQQEEERRERALLALPARRGRFLICCFLCAAVLFESSSHIYIYIYIYAHRFYFIARQIPISPRYVVETPHFTATYSGVYYKN